MECPNCQKSIEANEFLFKNTIKCSDCKSDIYIKTQLNIFIKIFLFLVVSLIVLKTKVKDFAFPETAVFFTAIISSKYFFLKFYPKKYKTLSISNKGTKTKTNLNFILVFIILTIIIYYFDLHK